MRLDATREAKQIRMHKSCCSNNTVHTALIKQCIMQQSDLTPFFLRQVVHCFQCGPGLWLVITVFLFKCDNTNIKLVLLSREVNLLE